MMTAESKGWKTPLIDQMLKQAKVKFALSTYLLGVYFRIKLFYYKILKLRICIHNGALDFSKNLTFFCV